MGPKGTIDCARSFFADFDLRAIRARSETGFNSRLDLATQSLMHCLPRTAQYWGSCRKFLNIFLRGCIYNRYLCEHFRLEALEPWLELPLDSHVAKGLAREEGAEVLPRWTTVIGLTPQNSLVFQTFARKIAVSMNTHRVHLDLLYWRGNHIRRGSKSPRLARRNRITANVPNTGN
jgi:hypothetical protein